MIIRLLKDTDGNITGFISHISRPEKHPKGSLLNIPNNDYKVLFYYLLGRDHVKEKGGIGSVNIAGITLKDEGDHIEKHEKHQKDIMKFKPKHLLN